MSAPAVDLKREGQDRSQLQLTPEQARDLMLTIDRRPAGIELSANDLRPRLDHLGVPERARGGLFGRAVAAGLLEPVMLRLYGGGETPKRIPSTGRSAHAAHVLVYRRTDVQYLGSPRDPT